MMAVYVLLVDLNGAVIPSKTVLYFSSYCVSTFLFLISSGKPSSSIFSISSSPRSVSLESSLIQTSRNHQITRSLNIKNSVILCM